MNEHQQQTTIDPTSWTIGSPPQLGMVRTINDPFPGVTVRITPLPDGRYRLRLPCTFCEQTHVRDCTVEELKSILGTGHTATPPCQDGAGGRQLGLVARPKYRALLRRLGIDSAVAPEPPPVARC